jgi:hypothetical protein
MADKVKIKVINKYGDVENLWADTVDGNNYRIDSSPFFAYGLSWKDVVEASLNKDGVLQFNKIVKKSGHKTIRITSTNDKDIDQKFIESLLELGATTEGVNKKFIAIDIPPSKDFSNIIALVKSSEYEWEYGDPTYEDVNQLN